MFCLRCLHYKTKPQMHSHHLCKKCQKDLGTLASVTLPDVVCVDGNTYKVLAAKYTSGNKRIYWLIQDDLRRYMYFPDEGRISGK